MTLKVRPNAIEQNEGPFILPGLILAGTRYISTEEDELTLAPDGNLILTSVSGQIHLDGPSIRTTVDDGLIHATNIVSSLDDSLQLRGNAVTVLGNAGQELVELSPSEIIFNDPGNDVDVRIGGSSQPNLMVVDAGNDNISLGASSTLESTTRLHIQDDRTSGFHANANKMTTVSIGSGGAETMDFTALEWDGLSPTFHFGFTNLNLLYDPTTDSWSHRNSSMYGLQIDLQARTTEADYIIKYTEDGSVSFQSVAEFGSSGIVINEDGNDLDVRIEGTTNPNVLFVDAGNDTVVIGANNTESTYALEVVTEDVQGRQVEVYGYHQTLNPFPGFTYYGARGTRSSPAAIQNGDWLGSENFRAYDGTVFTATRAYLAVIALEDWDGSNQGAKIEMEATKSGGTARAHRMTLGDEIVFNDDGSDIDFRVESSGTPDALKVVGSDGGIVMGNLLAAAASTDVNINGSNELHSVTSSERFKKYIGDLGRRFDSSLIYDLKPKSFVWRKDTGNPDMEDFGLIAEDVHRIMPELVNYDEDGNPWSIRYSMLPVMLLVEMTKMESRVSRLEKGMAT